MSILNPLFEAVAWVIRRIHDVLSVPFGAASGWSWGLSIVLLVMLMRLIMVPLFVKQVKSQRKMQSHMPALQEIRKKYKNDKTRLNEETMKFYKENGINPLGGCLPLIAQLPVFWSLFNVLKAIADWTPGHAAVSTGCRSRPSTSARTAHIFGVLLSDKFLWATTGESWTVRAVILLSVAVSATTTFLTMRQSAKRGMMNQQVPDPDQPGAAMAQSMSKNMMYIAPFFALTGLYWQYGLVIYWVTTNVWTLGQQHILFRNLPIVGSATVGASAAAGGISGATGLSLGAQRSRGDAARRGEASNGSARRGEQARARQASRAPRASPMRRATAKVPAAKASRGQAGCQRRRQAGCQRRGEQRYGQLLGGGERRAGIARVRQEEAGAGGQCPWCPRPRWSGSSRSGRRGASVPVMLAMRARGERLWGIVPVRGSARW